MEYLGLSLRVSFSVDGIGRKRIHINIISYLQLLKNIIVNCLKCTFILNFGYIVFKQAEPFSHFCYEVACYKMALEYLKHY